MSSNFKIFDENASNIMSDSDYNADTQRLDGVVPGLASSALHNKLFRQTSVMATAIAEALSNAGYTIDDSDYAGIVAAIEATFGGLAGVEVINSNPLAGADSKGKVFIGTGTFSFGLDDVATLGDSWYCYLYNAGSGVITIDPDGTETCDGLLTVTLGPNNGCFIVCDATALYTVGRKPEYISIRDEKAANTEGGTFTSGAWRTRDLNIEAIDTGNNCTLAANQFTLRPGTYRIQASAPAMTVLLHKAKLRNITAGSDTLIGTSEFIDLEGGNGGQTRSIIGGQFSIATATVFEIQHQCLTTRATDGFGNASNFGVVEVYTTVELWKVI